MLQHTLTDRVILFVEILRAIADTFKVSAEQANGLVNIRETKIEQ